jgi:hypothetical protein
MFFFLVIQSRALSPRLGERFIWGGGEAISTGESHPDAQE